VVPIIDAREKEQAMKQVLIIDDSPQIRERIAATLAESPQIRIAGQAGNGCDALDAVQRLKPDTVILDIRCPTRAASSCSKPSRPAIRK
jgi:chemotaxis response regulator CheB